MANHPESKDNSMVDQEKHDAHGHEIEDSAAAGHVATDEHGNPLFATDEKAEAKLRRKIDWCIVPPVALLYIFCFIDRANIGNARLAGLTEDLNLQGVDFNIILSVFYVTYTIFELPSNILCKIVGPGKYLPLMTVAFGLLSMCTAFATSFGSMVAVRTLLGVSEAAMLPGIAYYMSRWYRKDELVFRLALYIVCAPLAGAFGGLLASAILTIDSIGSVVRWQMIFLVEGIITIGVGIIGWFTLTDRPATAKWLSAEEKALAEYRIKSENVATRVVLDKVKGKAIWQGAASFNTLVVGLIFLLDNITVQGVAFFTPTLVRAIYPDVSVVEVQLRTVPPYIVGAFFTVLVPYLSWKTKSRLMWMVVSAPFMIGGWAIFVGTLNSQARYAGTFLITTGAFSFGALCPSLASQNVVGDASRSAAIAVVVGMGNIGGLISTWSFLTEYAPRYLPGAALNLAVGLGILLLSLFLWWWQKKQNKISDSGKHDHRLEGLSPEEEQVLGIKHPLFRYHH